MDTQELKLQNIIFSLTSMAFIERGFWTSAVGLRVFVELVEESIMIEQ